MTEPAYRSAHHLGAGALGGAGLGDEFVLVDAKVSPAKATAETTTSKSAMSSAASSPSSATCADQGVAYRLTGHTEEQLKALVGHQLEVQGRFKHADDVTASGAPTSGNLPAEVEMVSYREAPAPAPVATTTPAPVTQPPAASAPLPPTPAVTAPSTPAPATTEPKELPHAAGSSGLIALIGVLALGSGLVLAVWRRRLA